MADTQHNLRIKATLDTSQLQQEIDRLNQKDGQGSAGTSSTQSTTRILNKLDSTLNKLNATINRLADAMRHSSPGGANLRMSDGSGYFMAKAFDQMSNREFADAVRQIDQHRPDVMAKVASSAGLTEQELQILRMRGIISDSTAAKINTVKKAQAINPPIVSQNVMHVFPDGSFQLAPRDTPMPVQQPQQPQGRPSPQDVASFRRALQAYGVGSITNMVGSQLNQFGQLAESGSTTQMVLQGVGNVLGAAGSGAMAGAAFGPHGAIAGAALAGLSQAAIDVSKAFQQLESKITDYIESANKAYGSASTSLITASAQYRFNDLSQFNIGSYQETIDTLQKRRIGQLTQIKELTSGDITKEDAETLRTLQQQLAKTESELAAYESALATLMQRRAETSTEEEEAGKALARAEREFADALIAEERAIAQWHSDSQSNIKSYREAQKQYMETMLRGRESTQDRMQRMGFERDVQMVKLGMWRGANAEDQFKNARRLRTQIMDLNAEALSTDSPKRLEEIQKLITGMQGEFQHAMMMGQLLKDLGSPLQKLQLGSLTSLANRGVNMGERTEMQRPYDKKMDEMVDILQNIEENTRAAEKAIWE